MKISVTQEHIRNGKRGSSCDCPVALAVRDALRGSGLRLDKVYVSGLLITTSAVVGEEQTMWGPIPKRRSYCWRWTDAVDQFVTMFDDGEKVVPFEFELGEEVSPEVGA